MRVPRDSDTGIAQRSEIGPPRNLDTAVARHPGVAVAEALRITMSGCRMSDIRDIGGWSGILSG